MNSPIIWRCAQMLKYHSLKKILKYFLSPSILLCLSKYSHKCQENRKQLLWAKKTIYWWHLAHFPLEPTRIVWPSIAHTALWPWSPLLLAVLLLVIKICCTHTAGIACTFECKPHKYRFILLFHDYNMTHTWIYCYFKYLFYSSSLSIISSLSNMSSIDM